MKTLIKESFVSIKKSYKRFISILAIVLLGVGFFAGIKATSPDMQDTLNNYYEETNFQDINLLSTWGVTEEEIAYLQEQGYNVEGIKTLDALVNSKEDENKDAVKVLSYNKDKKINNLSVIEGRLPESENECVVDYSDVTTLHQIGEELIVNDDNLKTKKYEVVGIVKTPLYISLERGTTNLSSGKINYFIYVLESEFDTDYYTEAVIRLVNLDTFSKEYDALVETEVKKLEEITTGFAEKRYDNEKNKALEEYNDSALKLKKEKDKFNKEITSAKTKLSNGKKEYESGLKELKANKTKFNSEYSSQKETLNNSLTQINNEITNIENSLPYITDEETLNTLNQNLLVLEIQKEEISNGLLVLEQTKVNYQNEFAKAEKTLVSTKQTLEESEKELNTNIKKANKEFAKAEEKLVDALEEIDNLEKPTWYVLDRDTNIGHYQYKQDTERIANLGQIFPLVFFVVAILVCLTSMTRMVEEERSQLGTLKSLGYSNSQILFKYIIYALTATLVGSIIGLHIGFKLLPTIIFKMYSMMYNIGDIIISFNIYYALLGTLCAIACTLGATIIVAQKSLKEQPAMLMRPKSVKSGKRIILEGITFIWKRLKFTQKVTFRNVFRYKKRMLMTIIGVSGCTGLIIAGFGLRDCITGMVGSQYNDIFTYELEVSLEGDDKKDEVINKLNQLDEVKETLKVHKESITLDEYDTNQAITLVVPFDNTTNFIKLQDRKTQESFDLSNGLIISEKLANLLGIKQDDKLVISGEDSYEVKVSAITENYLYHFIYMNKDVYNSDEYNSVLVKTIQMTEKEEKVFAEKIKEIEGVSSLSFTSTMSHAFDNTMENFEYVVIVLIVAANLLAFVVLYNLASVNMSERQRELATIKVLGFYNKEVFNYIGRETTILTIISLIFGMGVGRILTTFIIKTCELDMIMFNPTIKITSYLYGIVLTIVFTLIVNITTYFALKKIKMVESLKSVE
ncbi:MAG: FtsX-like permease family protein [Bacilli bacterium]|nr:FtsX-like permease family protein [Bacilli bacterium]